MREATASTNREPEIPTSSPRQVVPVDLEAILRFEAESPESTENEGVPVVGSEASRVTPFPTVSHAAAPAEEAQPEPAAPATSTPQNWRKFVVPLLIAVVLTQAGLLTYWRLSRNAAPLAASTTGRVSITSEPTGSNVTVDGSVSGQTPLAVPLNPGTHHIIVGTGTAAHAQDVTVSAGGESSMHVQLPLGSAAQAAATSGTLQVATEPVGARLWVDGQPRGTTPATIADLESGEHAVTVQADGGDPVKRTVKVQQGTTASLIITMPGARGIASGWLTISSPVPLQVMEKGQLLGSTDVPRLMLPTGEHELELVNSGLNYRLTRNVSVAAGRTATFTVVPPRGTLSVNAMPWAEVWIDGQPAGETPIGNYSIPIGTHELLFRHPDLGEQRKTVTVGAQGPVRIGVDMKKP